MIVYSLVKSNSSLLCRIICEYSDILTLQLSNYMFAVLFFGCIQTCILINNSADCSNLNLDELPYDLPPGIHAFKLNYNNIQRILNDSFWIFRNLENLTISYNKLIYLEPHAFEGLRSLKVMKMSGNMLKFSVYTRILFKLLNGITVLDIGRNVNL